MWREQANGHASRRLIGRDTINAATRRTVAVFADGKDAKQAVEEGLLEPGSHLWPRSKESRMDLKCLAREPVNNNAQRYRWFADPMKRIAWTNRRNTQPIVSSIYSEAPQRRYSDYGYSAARWPQHRPALWRLLSPQPDQYECAVNQCYEYYHHH